MGILASKWVLGNCRLAQAPTAPPLTRDTYDPTDNYWKPDFKVRNTPPAPQKPGETPVLEDEELGVYTDIGHGNGPVALWVMDKNGEVRYKDVDSGEFVNHEMFFVEPGKPDYLWQGRFDRTSGELSIAPGNASMEGQPLPGSLVDKLRRMFKPKLIMRFAKDQAARTWVTSNCRLAATRHCIKQLDSRIMAVAPDVAGLLSKAEEIYGGSRLSLAVVLKILPKEVRTPDGSNGDTVVAILAPSYWNKERKCECVTVMLRQSRQSFLPSAFRKVDKVISNQQFLADINKGTPLNQNPFNDLKLKAPTDQKMAQGDPPIKPASAFEGREA